MYAEIHPTVVRVGGEWDLYFVPASDTITTKSTCSYSAMPAKGRETEGPREVKNLKIDIINSERIKLMYPRGPGWPWVLESQ